MVRPCYDPETDKFCSLHQTVGFLVVRGSPEEVLFNYGFNKEKSKVFYSHYWRKIPNSFSGTIFNRHRTMIESGEIEGEMSNIFFLPPLYNWQFRGHKQISEQRLNFSNRNHSTTVKQLKWNSFWSIQAWHLWYWKNTMNDAVIKCLKNMNDVSNSNIVRNADGLLSRKEFDVPVAWVGEHKQRLPPQKFKVSYWVLL